MMLEHARLRCQRRIDPVDERQHRAKPLPENLLPLQQVQHVPLGRPAFIRSLAGTFAALSSLDVDQKVRAIFAVDDEVEAFEFGVGEQRLFCFVNGDVWDAAGSQKRLKRRLVMYIPVCHAAPLVFGKSAFNLTAVRIIAGEFRGRKLIEPASTATRPITDRAKQSLFDILAPYLCGAVVYDCFAGTGSLGLEALSRGAAKAVFFEFDRSAVQRLLKNITALGVASRCKVVAADVFRYFKSSRMTANLTDQADIVFLDPPYRLVQTRPQDLQNLAISLADKFLAENAVVVFRHSTDDCLELGPLTRYDQRQYGRMLIELLRLRS